MKIPFLDLKSQYESIKDEIDQAIQNVFESCAFAGGRFVEQFEKSFANFCQCDYAVGVGSGTEALWIALLALGIKPGDEVITVPNTFFATAEAISFCGAKPVFVDIDEHTYNMDPNLIESAITPRTKAIIPVHIFGHMADMDPIMEIARRHNLYVIEDACQAHGAEYKGKRAGSIGDAGCFSFYPGKNLGAYGEAGAVVTNNKELAENIAKFRDHGQSEKYYHSMVGWNARMDGIQGAILDVKLKRLPEWNEARRKNASLYDNLLVELEGVHIPQEAEYAKHVYHVYAIRIQNRDELLKMLAENKIYCGIHYPISIHHQKAYSKLGYRQSDLPVAEKAASEFLSLPMYPELAFEQQKQVKDKIQKYYYENLKRNRKQ
jgi:dTDP-4-amino-4,6-dideoxygalactose transaminase